jgi:hypothetical protein
LLSNKVLTAKPFELLILEKVASIKRRELGQLIAPIAD